MTFKLKPLLAGAVLLAALAPMAQAQGQSQTGAAPCKTAPGAAQPVRNAQNDWSAGSAGAGQRNRDHDRGDRRARRHHHDDDDDGWFFFGRHGHRDDDDRRGTRAGRAPAAAGTTAPPANGLFNQGGARPQAQVD